jgi:hypothetical protein
MFRGLNYDISTRRPCRTHRYRLGIWVPLAFGYVALTLVSILDCHRTTQTSLPWATNEGAIASHVSIVSTVVAIRLHKSDELPSAFSVTRSAASCRRYPGRAATHGVWAALFRK